MRAIRAVMAGGDTPRRAARVGQPPATAPASAVRRSRPYLPRQERVVYGDIKQMVLADQDTRAKASFSGAFPQARRDLPRVQEFVRERHGATR